MSRVTIEIPDGKLCWLRKHGVTTFECPCLKMDGSPTFYRCGLYREFLDDCTTNSIRKCTQCKEDNK